MADFERAVEVANIHQRMMNGDTMESTEAKILKLTEYIESLEDDILSAVTYIVNRTQQNREQKRKVQEELAKQKYLKDKKEFFDALDTLNNAPSYLFEHAKQERWNIVDSVVGKLRLCGGC